MKRLSLTPASRAAGDLGKHPLLPPDINCLNITRCDNVPRGDAIILARHRGELRACPEYRQGLVGSSIHHGSVRANLGSLDRSKDIPLRIGIHHQLFSGPSVSVQGGDGEDHLRGRPPDLQLLNAVNLR